MTNRQSSPIEVLPPPGPRKYWTRRGFAEWLVEFLPPNLPALVGIDHAFSFPLRHFETHQLPQDWPLLLDDFQHHRSTDGDDTCVDIVWDGSVGSGAEPLRNRRWRRLKVERAGTAESAFHFDIQGSVAKSTHAGLPWLRYLRQRLGDRVHFWPLDGWSIPTGRSAMVEVYPALWSRSYPRDARTPDQPDAWAVASWLQAADLRGRLPEFLAPALSPTEHRVAVIEGWILGIR